MHSKMTLMIEKQITAKITYCLIDELSMEEKDLVDAAKRSAGDAYAPYSAFSVGAAVRLENGETICGNNQENAAYPSGLCAERVTLFYANARYPDSKPLALAIAAKDKDGFTPDPISPCGACRQVLVETEKRFRTNIKLILYGRDKIAVIEKVSYLLPLSFSL